MYKICAVSPSEAIVSFAHRSVQFFDPFAAFSAQISFLRTAFGTQMFDMTYFLEQLPVEAFKVPPMTSDLSSLEALVVPARDVCDFYMKSLPDLDVKAPDIKTKKHEIEFMPTLPSNPNKTAFSRRMTSNPLLASGGDSVITKPSIFCDSRLTWYGPLDVEPQSIPSMSHADLRQQLLHGWVLALGQTTGMSHGLIVYGQPGSGKTTALRAIFNSKDTAIYVKKEDVTDSLISTIQRSKALYVVIEDVDNMGLEFNSILSARTLLNADQRLVNFIFSTSNPNLKTSCSPQWISLVHANYCNVALADKDYRYPDSQYGGFMTSSESLTEMRGDYAFRLSTFIEAYNATLLASPLGSSKVSSESAANHFVAIAQRVVLTLDRPLNFLSKSMLCHLLDQLDRPGFSLVIVHPDKKELIQQLRDLNLAPTYQSRLKLLDLDLSKKYPERLRDFVAYWNAYYSDSE